MFFLYEYNTYDINFDPFLVNEIKVFSVFSRRSGTVIVFSKAFKIPCEYKSSHVLSPLPHKLNTDIKHTFCKAKYIAWLYKVYNTI